MRRSTKKTDERQQETAALYAKLTGTFLEKAPGGWASPVDYVARESSRYGAAVVAVLELKRRTYREDEYVHVWCEVDKVFRLRSWAEKYATTGYFVVEWACGTLRRIEVEALVEAAGAPVWRRRMDRDDPRDLDQVYEVPIHGMERLGERAPEASGEAAAR